MNAWLLPGAGELVSMQDVHGRLNRQVGERKEEEEEDERRHERGEREKCSTSYQFEIKASQQTITHF